LWSSQLRIKGYIETRESRCHGVKLETIALVTLVRSGTNESSREMIEQIREVLQFSKLSKTWTIEKISLLQEPEAVVA
jgi:ribosomal protein L17